MINKLVNFIRRCIKKFKLGLNNATQDSIYIIKGTPKVRNNIIDASCESEIVCKEGNTAHSPAGSMLDSLLKMISKETVKKKPTIVSDEGFISKSISTKETDEGLEMHIEKPLIVAACGKVIPEDQIAIKCSVCGKYDCKEHSFLCHFCGRALCILHVHFFKDDEGKNVPCCAEHHREAVENQDMWQKNV